MWGFHLSHNNSSTSCLHRSSGFPGEWLCVCVGVCVHMEEDGIWKIPKLGVICGLMLFLSAISLTPQCISSRGLTSSTLHTVPVHFFFFGSMPWMAGDPQGSPCPSPSL